MRHWVITAGILAGTCLVLADDCPKAGDAALGCKKEGVTAAGCPRERVAKLLVSWKEVAEAERTCCPTAKAKLAEEIGVAVKDCPMGSRLGTTLAFAREVLDTASTIDERCAKAVPATAPTETPCEGRKTLEARSSLIRDMKALVAYAATTVPGAGACAKSCTATTPAAAGTCVLAPAGATASTCPKAAGSQETAVASKDGCCAKAAGSQETALASKDGCCAKAAGCPIEKAVVCATELKASWAKVGGEFASMCPEKKKALMTAMAGFQSRSKAVALVPETVLTLAAGFEALDSMDQKLDDFAKSHPEAVKALGEAVVKDMQNQARIVREAKEVFTGVRVAMESVNGSPATAPKAVASSAN